MLSQGLPNTPMANSRIRVIGGNFITGQPIGVLDGIDMHYAGKVRKVDGEGINAQLGLGNIVLLNCEGPSPTGEIFNLQMEEAAEAVAVAIKADKLVYLTDSRASRIKQELLDEMTPSKSRLLNGGEWLSPDIRRYLPCAVRSTNAGVGRVHLISYEQDGALLRELFTHDGVGTVVTRESLENIREAKPDDIAALIALIEPMEAEGILVHRPRELLEREIDHFSIMLHDGIIVGCAALYTHSEEEAELACLAVSHEHREWGYGEQLMKRIERRARKSGIKRLIVLTTRTEHWFVERGFKVGTVDDLPAKKRDMYNYQRRSKVLFKTL
jgi:amino-acid N-acetyltransferase